MAKGKNIETEQILDNANNGKNDNTNA